MAEKVTIARPYAEAAFALARAASASSAWMETLTRLAAVAQSQDFLDCIGNPQLQQDQLLKLISGLSGGSLPADQLKFVEVLADNKRLDVLPEIAEHFAELKNASEGVQSVDVESAYPLDDAGLRKIIGDLEQKYGGKYQASVRVVPELIGGVRIAIGDDVIDASVRGKLAAMAAAIKC